MCIKGVNHLNHYLSLFEKGQIGEILIAIIQDKINTTLNHSFNTLYASAHSTLILCGILSHKLTYSMLPSFRPL